MVALLREPEATTRLSRGFEYRKFMVLRSLVVPVLVVLAVRRCGRRAGAGTGAVLMELVVTASQKA